MPEMDGIELLKRIRQNKEKSNFSSICIALTANVIEGAAENYLKVGFDDYMAKPVDSTRLEETLLKYIPKEKLQEADLSETEEAVIDEKLREAIKTLGSKNLLDIESGIGYAGSMAMFADTLKVFKESIDSKADEIEELYFKDDFENYGIKVHALKSAAKLIGAQELSDRAKALEEAAKKNDIDYIRDNNYELISQYRSFKDILIDI